MQFFQVQQAINFSLFCVVLFFDQKGSDSLLTLAELTLSREFCIIQFLVVIRFTTYDN